MGLSQERLGILAGIDPMSASARLNQYERGKHKPNVVVARQLATVLNVPEAYFYAADDETARLLVLFQRLPADRRQELLNVAESMSGTRRTGNHQED